jgi:hypothetical protein
VDIGGRLQAQRCYDFQCQELGATFFQVIAMFFVLRTSEEAEPVRDDG